MTVEIPYGTCHCGCGRKTTIAPQSSTREGWVKGEPLKFVRGHGRRLSGVEYLVAAGGCWEWQLSKDRSTGYGRTAGNLWAHRVYYAREFGEIPPGFDVHHRCENRACVNPAHLELVKHTEHGRHHRKLTASQVTEIRRRRSVGETTVSLGKAFGIHSASVSRICSGQRWAT